MTTATPAAKICVSCNQDCADKPRSKDAQGRYLCKACSEKLKAKAGAGAAKAPRPATPPIEPVQVENSVLSTLLADSPDPCTNCSAPLPKGTVICNFCGFNKDTGQGTKTRVLRAPKEKKEKTAGEKRPSFVLEPLHVGAIAIGLQVAMFFACIFNHGFVVPLYAVTLLCGLVGFVMFICYAVTDGGLVWLLASIFVPIAGPLLGVFYVFFVSERGHLKAMMLANILGTLMAGAAMTGIVAGEMEEAGARGERSGHTAPE